MTLCGETYENFSYRNGWFSKEDLHLIPRLVDAAKKERLKIVGTGENLVDVTYVQNDAHNMVLEKLALQSPPAARSFLSTRSGLLCYGILLLKFLDAIICPP